ncbi:P-type conjugative transfer protein TrbG [Govanella unica]|uniref:P-type conjugative transfer protein TrbG n=1 Tax=Govanella unica TaxID=2975056 RepID=A0A9X3TXB2_9PROT|nr:P-type conjugative transfer protein TrbG [Govania unica]MDA5193715.1 P-type conjugative transfer protein TrbG [Govania unica]
MTRFIQLMTMVLGLSACASEKIPQEMPYDPAAFRMAAMAQDPAPPVEIIVQPEPLPLPGQLKPATSLQKTLSLPAGAPEDRILAANDAARIQPIRDGYLNAIQIYPYMEGALYQLYAAPEQVSDIALQKGEEIVAVSAGDTVRWIIGDVVSGDGADARAHVLVKPIKEDLRSNLVIITDRRAYHLELNSTSDAYMASISWTYPQDALLALKRGEARKQAQAEQVIGQGLELDQLRFRYRIGGDNPPWRPIHVFDDTHKVYIQFPDRLDQGEAPPLFVIGDNGGTELVNYRKRGNFYIVDRLFKAAELRLGEKPQQVVRITRSNDVSSRKPGEEP